MLLEKGKTDQITQQLELAEQLEAPVAVGDEIGRVKFMLDGKQVGGLTVTSANDVDKITFFNSLAALLAAALKP